MYSRDHVVVRHVIHPERMYSVGLRPETDSDGAAEEERDGMVKAKVKRGVRGGGGGQAGGGSSGCAWRRRLLRLALHVVDKEPNPDGECL